MKTIKQIADETGISKTTVISKIDKLGLRDSLQKKGSHYIVDEEQRSKK